MSLISMFGRRIPAIIGMIHVRALPGSPCNHRSMKDIVEIACTEAQIYKESNVDGLIVENMHDRPWLLSDHVGPETTASMAVVCNRVREVVGSNLPVGVQVLSAANRQALAIAKAADLDFIRAEGFVFSHIGDEGFIDSCAADLIRYRKAIGAENVKIFTDIKKKHSSHSITDDITLLDAAEAAKLFLSDGLIITGTATGMPTNPKEVHEIQSSVNLPVFVGSGVTKSNVCDYLSASGLIIGSHLKVTGQWDNELDADKTRDFLKHVNIVRENQDLATTEEKRGTQKVERFHSINSEGA